ncbi:MAG: lysylphosphatidylglycerol synthase transmembrane domain-containing protein [Mycobacteriales bacterium]
MPSSRTQVLGALGLLALLVATGAGALVQAALGTGLLLAASVLALNASRVRPLATRWSLSAVLACTAGNAVTPAGLGGSVLMLRLHTRTGLSPDEAVAAVTVRALASGAVGVLVGVTLAVTMGRSMPTLPGEAPVLLASLGALALTALLIALLCPRRRGRWAAHLRSTCSAVAAVLTHPSRAGMLVVGALGVTGAQLLIFDGAVRAVGGEVGLISLLFTLFGSSAARAVLPSPGGVGPVETALVAGLTATGVPLGAAALAVGVYRVAAFGLPVIAGVFALRWLRRSALL